MNKESKFTGSAWGLFGWNLLMALSAYFLLIPLAFIMPKYLKWYYSNVQIDGKNVEFDYEGPWWGVIGWILFSIVTLGIGAFYAEKKMIQFEISHTHVIGENDKKSHFDGDAWGILGWSLLSILGVYLLLIPIAFIVVSINRWYNSYTFISGKQLSFDHEGPWWGAIGWILFSIITLGIGSFYAQKKQIQWVFRHTHFKDSIVNT